MSALGWIAAATLGGTGILGYVTGKKLGRIGGKQVKLIQKELVADAMVRELETTMTQHQDKATTSPTPPPKFEVDSE